jgi:hypothetical protein
VNDVGLERERERTGDAPLQPGAAVEALAVRRCITSGSGGQMGIGSVRLEDCAAVW